ncbi:MAG: arylsulfatase [Bacteroidetes bacterium]|nr:arylsulfatase [Fibrella sp.]
MRLKFNLLIVLCGCLSLTVSSAQSPKRPTDPSPTRPNIILIMTDDQGYGDLACHGNPWLKTPNIDKLHAQSVRLTNYHTGTTCAPTRASLMTGQYHNRVGVWHTIAGRSLLRKGVPTMADMLKQNGYRTAIFGKWHLGDDYPSRPQERGFQEVLIHGGGGVGQTPDAWNNDYFDDTYQHNGQPKPYKGYCTDVWFTEATKYIEANRERPFFCYITPNAPHWPYHVADSYRNLYANNPAIPNPAFYGMITNLDENVGRLMQQLQALGLADNTIVIFTTDNGSAAGATVDKAGQVTKGFNAGMRGMKSSPYEGGHHVPFLVRYPNGQLSGGRDVPQIAACTDVLPTLLSLCRIPATTTFDGTDLTPLLQGKPTASRTLLVDTQREDTLKKNKPSAVMTDRWRLINNRELYDLPGDPAQQRDVAAQYPDTVRRLQQAYETWWTHVSQRKDEYVRIGIGGPENPVQLTCHDLHPDNNGKATPAWNQETIRLGSPALTGSWAIDILKAGTYTVSLRRWPTASGLKNTDKAPMTPPVAGAKSYAEGKVFQWQRAYLNVGDKKMQMSVPDDGSAPVFSVSLPKGPAMLRAWFTDAVGSDVSAFYLVLDNDTAKTPAR